MSQSSESSNLACASCKSLFEAEDPEDDLPDRRPRLLVCCQKPCCSECVGQLLSTLAKSGTSACPIGTPACATKHPLPASSKRAEFPTILSLMQRIRLGSNYDGDATPASSSASAQPATDVASRKRRRLVRFTDIIEQLAKKKKSSASVSDHSDESEVEEEEEEEEDDRDKNVLDRACFYCDHRFILKTETFIICQKCYCFTACQTCWASQGNKAGWTVKRLKIRQRQLLAVDADTLESKRLWVGLEKHKFTMEHAVSNDGPSGKAGDFAECNSTWWDSDDEKEEEAAAGDEEEDDEE